MCVCVCVCLETDAERNQEVNRDWVTVNFL